MNPHLKYAKYVIRHKWFVFVAGRKVGVSRWRLIKHDWSKFLPCEWSAYVNYFYREYSRSYGPDVRPNEEANIAHWESCRDRRFDAAWLHHQHVNDHHWQHWIIRNDDGTVKCLPMPEAAWKEMIADWMGAGRAITGEWEVHDWYERNRSKIALHDGTRVLVESELSKLFRGYSHLR